MKRDMDVIRSLLLFLEASNESPLAMLDVSHLTTDPQLAYYNVMLAREAGLIEALDLSTYDGFHWAPKRLTWAGHEYLDSIRDDEVWKVTKATAKKIGGFTLQILADVAKEVIKGKARELGIPI